ncbi:2-amino-4-hydroxy-6-hydroxymethyldihydropteridine diphosphokinase [Hippea alviniae]|uniref:2-amino-4-hydroxy-6- hydroxymethyldihydropteridine diphosphokinase n=1 Tax=Hippea alviniae TaxID=1279027 RepID=UPI0003B52D29|nr:2-amino-4-hydroxy-6-hydroxymethyldihydropteridine diphosphokinase [Hippea alviniae]
MYNRWVYLSLGSNVGNRRRNINWAVVYLSKRVNVISKSSIIETEAWGYKKQKKFLNCALKVDCKLKPFELLKFCKNIERKLRRVKKFKWGPRTVDVDIVAFKNIILKRKRLWLPHRHAHQRLFVIEPLMELDAKLKFEGFTLEEHKSRLEGR